MTCDINFPLWSHYLLCQCDVINVKNFHEILRYLFQILATPLLNDWFGPKWISSLKVKRGVNSILLPVFGSLYFIFCLIAFNFLNFQLLAKMLNFIFIEYAWKLVYLRWWYACSYFVPYYSPRDGVGWELFKLWIQIDWADLTGWMFYLPSNLIEEIIPNK